MYKKFIAIALLSFFILFSFIFTTRGQLFFSTGKESIIITAMGEKDNNSSDYGVSIYKIILDGKEIELNKLEPQNGWRFQPEWGVFSIFSQNPSSFKLEYEGIRNIEIIFEKTKSMGKVKIKSSNGEKIVNLYSDKRDSYSEKINVGDRFVLSSKGINVFCSLYFLIYFILLLIMFLRERFKKEDTLKNSKVGCILKYLTLSILIPLILFVSLIVTNLIPNNRIYDNIQSSYNNLQGENDYPRLPFWGNLDLFSDMVALNIVYNIRSDDPIKSALYPTMFTVEKESSTPQVETLGHLIHQDESMKKSPYAIYWHGYTVILRPMLNFFTYTEIRILNYTLFFTLFSIVCHLLYKKLNVAFVLSYILSLVLIDFFVVPMIFTGISTYIISFITILAILKIGSDKIGTMPIVFYITGALTVFFDFLINPQISLTMPLTVLVVLSYESKRIITVLQGILLILKVSFAWASGYVLTWISKWIIADLILGQNIILSALNRAHYRMFGNANESAGESLLFKAIHGNLQHFYNENIYNILIFGIVLIIIFLIFRRKVLNYPLLVCLGIIFTFPYIWYSLLAQHSACHDFFTYRIQCVSIMTLCIIYFECLNFTKIKAYIGKVDEKAVSLYRKI